MVKHANDAAMPKPRVLLRGLAMPEMARWHDGRLWFAHWGAGEIVAVDLDGESEVITDHVPPGFGWSIDWLPDGRLLVSGTELMRVEHDGSMVRHADLRSLSDFGWSDMVVDGRGNTYVNSVGFGITTGERFRPGIMALVTPDGNARKVADDLAFPNGVVITPDNATLIVAESIAGRLTAFDIAADGGLSNRRVWADVSGDGICLDAEGAVWCSVVHDGNPACLRVREGGQVLDRIPLERPCFACMLGGEDGRTLFMMVAEWWGVERMGELFSSSRTGQVLTTRAPAPHVGWP